MPRLFRIGDIVHVESRNKRSEYCLPAIVIDDTDVENLEVGVFDEWYENKTIHVSKIHDPKSCRR